MDTKMWMRMIPTVALVIFFIWGWLDTFQHSWLIFVVAGGAMAVLSGMEKNKAKETEETKPVKQEEDR
jgi:small neutral amino acid transporter SnatA (MarC family)